MSNQLPPHLQYKPSAEIVRAHTKWHAALEAANSSVKSMGHVRAPQAIETAVLPLFAHMDNLFVLLQADVTAYAEQVMLLSENAVQKREVIMGLHPDDVELLGNMLDEVAEKVTEVAKGLKDDSEPQKKLDLALSEMGDIAEALISARLEDEDLPDGDDEDDDDEDEPEAEPTEPEAPPETTMDEEPAPGLAIV